MTLQLYEDHIGECRLRLEGAGQMNMNQCYVSSTKMRMILKLKRNYEKNLIDPFLTRCESLEIYTSLFVGSVRCV